MALIADLTPRERWLYNLGHWLRPVCWLVPVAWLLAFVPASIVETPLGQLTIHQIAKPFLFGGVLILCIHGVFKLPPEAEYPDYWVDWGKQGVIFIAVTAAVCPFLFRWWLLN